MFSKGIATSVYLLARAFVMMIMVVVSGLAFQRQLMQPVGKSSSTSLAKSRGISRNRMALMSPAPSSRLIDPPPPEKNSLDPTKSVVVFPGGGLFFWWQAGFIRQRQKQGLLFADAYMVGASAGALSAVLAKCNVDMDFAFERALQLCDDNEVWTRPVGLLGTWGNIIRQWLDDLLPEDAAELCRGNVFVLVTVVEDISALPGRPILSRRRISDFANRQELIDCCMASVHIPFFMDGRCFNTKFRGLRLVDGSFLPSPEDLTVMNRLQGLSSEAQLGGHQPLDHIVDHKVDASLSDQAFVQLKPSAELVRELMTKGGAFAVAAHHHSSTGGTTEVKE